MPLYYVLWDIDIEADSPREAAEKALAIQRKPDSIATVFAVVERADAEPITALWPFKFQMVDLTPEEETDNDG